MKFLDHQTRAAESISGIRMEEVDFLAELHKLVLQKHISTFKFKFFSLKNSSLAFNFFETFIPNYIHNIQWLGVAQGWEHNFLLLGPKIKKLK